MILGVEELEHSGEGLRRVGGVERDEHEVPCFGRLDAGQHGLAVTQFSDKDDVGVLPNRAAQRGGEVGHVDADLALVDQRFLVFVVILDRILDGDDVPI